MPNILPGCVLQRVPNSKYSKLLRFTEFSPTAPLPRLNTLRRRRVETSPELAFALHMPSQALISKSGPLRFDDDLKSHLDWTLKAADALDAVAIRFDTPSEITPSARSRDLFAAYVDKLPKRDGRIWVWTFSGLWEPAAAYAFADTLGLVCSFDPLSPPFPCGKIGYAYLKALGSRVRFSTQTLRSVVKNLTALSTEKTYLALDSSSALRYALLLKRLIEEKADVTPGD
jgi:hypothetical protein